MASFKCGFILQKISGMLLNKQPVNLKYRVPASITRLKKIKRLAIILTCFPDHILLTKPVNERKSADVRRETVKMAEGLIKLFNQLGALGVSICGLIVIFFIVALYANILTRRRYLSLSEELALFCAGKTDSFRSDCLTWMAQEYESACEGGIDSVNTVSIIETGMRGFLKLCNLAEGFIKRANSLMITTGLFGTFIGLTYAVGRIGDIVGTTNTEALMSDSGFSTFSLLVASFQGMAVAFVTSLLGTGFSILYMIWLTFISAASAKELLIIQLEEFLDIKLAADLRESHPMMPKGTSAPLSETFETSVNQLTTSIQSLEGFNEGFTQNLDHVRTQLAEFYQVVNSTMDSVVESSAHFIQCAHSLKAATESITSHAQSLEQMALVMTHLENHLDASRKDRDAFLRTILEIPDRLLNYNEAAVARVEKR